MRHDALSYRADIDGLRGVAIIAVVLYHFGVPGFAGGFVGVDVFFIISGYLITAIIAGQVADGSFSVADFFERRVRRLLPTLLIVLVASLAAGLLTMPPADLKRLAASALATLALGANIHFSSQGGYFDAWLGEQPLLHMWSLAVEEQFYLLWPLLLHRALVHRPGVLVPGTVLLAAASLAASVHAATAFPLEGFYLPHTRAWELLAGCLLALGVLGAPPNRAVGELAGVVGLALVAVAVATYSEAVTMPGVAAVLPVVGAVLLVWSGIGRPPLVARLLSWRPLVLVGLVSYAWYLWHWPLLAFFRYLSERAPSPIETVALVAASFLLAVASWWLVEVPVRRRAWPVGRSRLAGMAVGSTLAVAAVAGISQLGGGLPWRFGPEMLALSRGALTARATDGDCDEPSAQTIRAGRLCMIGGGEQASAGILVWGDSHAWALRPALAELSAQTGRAVSSLVGSGCPPLVEAWPMKRHGRSEACAELNRAIAEQVASGRFGDIVLAARWNYYVHGRSADESRARTRYLQDARSQEASVAESRAVIERALARTLDVAAAAGARVWIVTEVPDPGYDVPSLLARRLIQGRSAEDVVGPTLTAHRQRGAAAHELFTRLSQHYEIRLIDPASEFCASGSCRVHEGGEPLYRDDHHLSIRGARSLVPLLEPVFTEQVEAAARARPLPGG